MRGAFLVGLLVLTLPAVSAPAPPEKDPTKKKGSGPMEIDFSPLTKATANFYKMKIVVKAADGNFTPISIDLTGKPGPTQAAQGVDTSLPAGWVRSLKGEKLIVKSYKGSPVKSIEIKLEGEKAVATPIVRPANMTRK
jgi:hypothetical protein